MVRHWLYTWQVATVDVAGPLPIGEDDGRFRRGVEEVAA